MINIILHGCNGKMGLAIRKLIEASDDCSLVAGIDREAGISSFPVFQKISDCTISADVIIDFSNAGSIPDLLDFITTTKIPAVICTTGLTQAMEELISKTSLEVAILRSANMSLGINLLASLLKRASALLYDSNFDIEIIEKHHNQKVDSPSGTALFLANAINETLDHQCEFVNGRENTQKKREHKEIGIHAIRGGTIVGEHSVIFAGKDEVIELTHIANSREVFAVGALRAAKFLSKKNIGLYNMQDLFDEL